MKITLIMVALSLVLIGSGWGASQSSVSQFGFTWTFDKEYEVGQYANGDWWVQGPVDITSISPVCQTISGRIINGSMINPVPGGPQGYDQAAAGWTPALNVAFGISAANPLQIGVSDAPIKSLISTLSKEVVPTKNGAARLKSAAILTVVKDKPSEDAFRPPYCGSKDFAELRKTDIDWNALAELAPVAGTPDIAVSEKAFERPWITHGSNYPSAAVMPEDNMPTYGREEARVAHTAALLLNLNFTQAQKEKLLIRFLQYGIDVSGIIAQPEARTIWRGNGGITNGKKLAGVFAARVFNHTEMIGRLAKSGKYLTEVTGYGPGNPPPDYIHFGNEDDQVFYVSQADVGATTGPQWAPDTRAGETHPYTQADLGMPEWCIREALKPWTGNNYWGATYRGVSGCTMPAGAMVGHIMNIKTIWNNPAFFDYCDRYMDTIKDGGPYAGKPWQWGSNGIDLYSSARFVWNMWHTYRSDYGCIYTGLDTHTHERQYQGCSQDITNKPGYTGRKKSIPAFYVGPNPMQEYTEFRLNKNGNAFIKIFDNKGNVVSTLVGAIHELPLRWMGYNIYGCLVNPGVYFYSVIVDGQTWSGRIVKAR
jgi:hypothetical protein